MKVKKARERINAINKALSLIAAGVPRGTAWTEAAQWCGCSRETLQYQWYPKVNGHHRVDWGALLRPRYSGGTARAECSAEAWEFFKADYIQSFEALVFFTAAQLAGTPGFPKTESGVLKLAKREKWESILRQGRGGGSVYSITIFSKERREALLLRYAPLSSAGPLFPAASCQVLPQGLDSSEPGVSPPGEGASYICKESSDPSIYKEWPEALTENAPLGSNADAADTGIKKGASIYKEYDRDELQARFARRADKQKAVAVKRFGAINDALRRIADGGTCTKSWAKAAQAIGYTRETLQHRWYPMVKGHHPSDWCALLCPGYKGGAARAEFSPEARKWLKEIYFRLEKPSFKGCYKRLKRAAQANNWVIPSFGTVRRLILREVPYQVRVLARDGNQGLMEIYPAQQRSVANLHALEWINGDGYEHNVFVQWPEDGICRPKTWFFQDVYSRKLLAWRTDQTEHTDLIRLATGDVIEKYGIPEHCTIDNTRAAANKRMTGGVQTRYRFKVKDDDPLGLFPMLGINVHWTSVNDGHGHGQAKPVERAFGVGGIGEIVDKHPAFAGAWTGNNPAEKPENYGSRAIPLAEFVRVLNDGVLAYNAQPNRRTEMCDGKLSFDEAFNESYQRSVIRKATAEQRGLWLLASEPIFIHGDATFTLKAGAAPELGRNRYYAAALYDYVGQKVVVRFDPDDLHHDTHIYSLDGKYICAAACVDPSGYGDTEAAREHNRARKQFFRATKEANKAHVRMSAIEAARLIPPMPNAEPVDATVIRMARPSRTLFEHRAPPQSTIPEEEQAVMRAELEDEFRVAREAKRWPEPFAMRDDEQVTYWHELHRRQQAGEAFPRDEIQQFYEQFPRSTTYRIFMEVERDLGTKAQ